MCISDFSVIGKTSVFTRALVLLLFFLRCVHSIPSPLPYDSAYTSLEPLDLQRTLKVRISMLTCSGISVIASLIAFYLFYRMEKQFRHQLIILLLVGDCIRATWYFVFAAVSLGRGTVKTESPFCQSSGFLMQFGETTSDYSVLVIAVHSALQIFQSVTKTTSEGLYTYRLFVYIGTFVIPSLTAGLAFVNSGFGYESLGAFCTLPIRPFWYRLTLAWVPRYVIAVIIIGLAIVINTYVRLQFRSISQSVVASQATQLPRASDDAGLAEPAVVVYNKYRARLGLKKELRSTQKLSLQNLRMSSGSEPSSLAQNTCLQPMKSSTDVSMPIADSCGVNVHAPTPQIDPALVEADSDFTEPQLGLHIELDHDHNAVGSLALRSLHVRRQLRLMFVYPLVYTLMWLVPFIHHCMMYMDRYARQPVWALRLGATICISSMGFVDCLIFFLRERPWQSTVAKTRRREKHRSTSQPLFRNVPPTYRERSERLSPIKSGRRSNDTAGTEAAQARLRLKLERAERMSTRREVTPRP